MGDETWRLRSPGNNANYAANVNNNGNVNRNGNNVNNDNNAVRPDLGLAPAKDALPESTSMGTQTVQIHGFLLKYDIRQFFQSVDYLGWHFYLTETGRVVRKQRTASKRRMKRRLKRMRRANANGKLSGAKAMEMVQSYLNHLSYGDTYALRRQITANLVLRGGYAEEVWQDDLAQLMWL